MHVAMGARPLVVDGVRAVAGAVIANAAVKLTARAATTACLTRCTFRNLRLGEVHRFSEGVIATTLSHQCPPAANVAPTHAQSEGDSQDPEPGWIRVVPGLLAEIDIVGCL